MQSAGDVHCGTVVLVVVGVGAVVDVVPGRLVLVVVGVGEVVDVVPGRLVVVVDVVGVGPVVEVVVERLVLVEVVTTVVLVVGGAAPCFQSCVSGRMRAIGPGRPTEPSARALPVAGEQNAVTSVAFPVLV